MSKPSMFDASGKWIGPGSEYAPRLLRYDQIRSRACRSGLARWERFMGQDVMIEIGLCVRAAERSELTVYDFSWLAIHFLPVWAFDVFLREKQFYYGEAEWNSHDLSFRRATTALFATLYNACADKDLQK